MQNNNFDVIQGDTWTLYIDYEDVDGNPIDISDYQIIAEVRNKPGGEILCAMSDRTNGITLENYPTSVNSIKVTFTPEQTAKFNLPKSAYQIKVVDTGDTLLNGWINVEAGVINV
jgi:hypothetical protein